MPPKEDEFWLQVAKRMEGKGEEHNTSEIGYSDYLIYGAPSGADFIHREATRVCVLAQKGRYEEVQEHLIDIVVFSALLWGYCQSLTARETPEIKLTEKEKQA